jgi:hypothetical protein
LGKFIYTKTEEAGNGREVKTTKSLNKKTEEDDDDN